jgi:hypothetical protein
MIHVAMSRTMVSLTWPGVLYSAGTLLAVPATNRWLRMA